MLKGKSWNGETHVLGMYVDHPCDNHIHNQACDIMKQGESLCRRR